MNEKIYKLYVSQCEPCVIRGIYLCEYNAIGENLGP